MRGTCLVVVMLASACAPTPCSATFSGPFAETIAGQSVCPVVLSAESLRFNVASNGGTLLAQVELPGAVHIERLTQATVSSWSASLGRDPGCVYSAATASTPAGILTLDVTSFDSNRKLVHGTLDLVLPTRSVPDADCGAADALSAHLEF